MIFYVYSLLNTINGKIYVGKTNNISKRWRDHKSISIKNNHKDYQVIHKAINKYGIDNFQFSIIQTFKTSEDALEAEKYWIDYYQTYIYKFGKEFGYNLTPGGDGMQLGVSAGVRNPKAKLSEFEVKQIFSSKEPTIELSKRYGVNRTSIQKIRSRKSWNSLDYGNIISVKGNYTKRDGEFSVRAKLNWESVSNIRKSFKSIIIEHTWKVSKN